MKKLQQGANLTIQSNANNFEVPAGYVLVPQSNLRSSTASNSNPKSGYGKNYSQNQKKREKEQLASSGDPGPILNLTPSPAPASMIVQSPSPAVAQPTGLAEAEALLGPEVSHAQKGAE